MFIQAWNAYVAVPKPKITHPNTYLPKPTKPSHYPRIAKLNVVMDLLCPRTGCNTTIRAKWTYPMDHQLLDLTPPRPGYIADLTRKLRVAERALGDVRYCEDCGIPSVIPPAQLAQWQRSLHEEITHLWLIGAEELLRDWLSTDGRVPPKETHAKRVWLRTRMIKFKVT